MVNGSTRGGVVALLFGAAALWILGPVLFFILVFVLGWGVASALPLILSWVIIANLPKLLKGVSVFAKMDEAIKNSLLLRLTWWGVTFYGAKLVLTYINMIPS